MGGLELLEDNFTEVYTKFKLQFYKMVFKRFETREASLTAVETFCIEAIYALKRPTINEFAKFTQISAPNAAYKINNLVKKGYLRKVQSTVDKREYYLEVTERYKNYSKINTDYIETVMKRIRERFPEEDVEKLDAMLEIMVEELMPETEFHSDES